MALSGSANPASAACNRSNGKDTQTGHYGFILVDLADLMLNISAYYVLGCDKRFGPPPDPVYVPLPMPVPQPVIEPAPEQRWSCQAPPLLPLPEAPASRWTWENCGGAALAGAALVGVCGYMAWQAIKMPGTGQLPKPPPPWLLNPLPVH